MAALKVEFAAHLKTIFERLGLSSDFQNGKSNNKYVCTPFNLMIEITCMVFWYLKHVFPFQNGKKKKIDAMFCTRVMPKLNR